MKNQLPPIRISAQGLRDFRLCGYRYARCHLLPLAPHERRLIRALGFGEIVHAVIADFFRHGAWGHVGQGDLETLLRVHWRDDLYAPDVADANYQRASELLSRFYEARYPNDLAREIGIERRHAWARYRRGMLAVGRIDFAHLRTDNTLEVIDWKTGRRRGGADALVDDEQALIYRSLAAEAYAVLAPRRILVSFVYLSSAVPLTIDFPHDQFVAGWERIEAIALAIRQSIAAVIDGASMLEAFPARRGVHCSMCPLGAHCDALAAAGRLIAPPEGGAA